MKLGARLTALIAFAAAGGMLALSFAAEAALFDVLQSHRFRRDDPDGNSTQPSRVLDRVVRVRFDANVGVDAPLEFKPEQPYIDVKLGETRDGLLTQSPTHRKSRCARSRPTTWRPTRSAFTSTSWSASAFNERTYQPGVTERLPVIFYVAAGNGEGSVCGRRPGNHAFVYVLPRTRTSSRRRSLRVDRGQLDRGGNIRPERRAARGRRRQLKG